MNMTFRGPVTDFRLSEPAKTPGMSSSIFNLRMKRPSVRAGVVRYDLRSCLRSESRKHGDDACRGVVLAW